MELTLFLSILIGMYILSLALLSYWRRSDSKHALFAKKNSSNNLKYINHARAQNFYGEKFKTHFIL